MERSFCLIATRCVAFKVLSLTLRTIVSQQGYKLQILPYHYIITMLGHLTSLVT